MIDEEIYEEYEDPADDDRNFRVNGRDNFPVVQDKPVTNPESGPIFEFGDHSPG